MEMRSLEYESFSVIYRRKNWCPGGMLSRCCSFPSLYYPRVGQCPLSLFLSLTRGNESILISSSRRDCFADQCSDGKPEDCTSPQHWLPIPSQPPSRKPSRSLSLPARRPAIGEEPDQDPGKTSLHYGDVHKGKETNQLAQEGPRASVDLLQRPLLLALCETLFNSPCRYLGKRHSRHLWTICPQGHWVYGWVCCFFICFCFLF